MFKTFSWVWRDNSAVECVLLSQRSQTLKHGCVTTFCNSSSWDPTSCLSTAGCGWHLHRCVIHSHRQTHTHKSDVFNLEIIFDFFCGLSHKHKAFRLIPVSDTEWWKIQREGTTNDRAPRHPHKLHFDWTQNSWIIIIFFQKSLILLTGFRGFSGEVPGSCVLE